MGGRERGRRGRRAPRGPGRGPAEAAGARVVRMRTAVILDRRGGALKPLLLLYRAGLGGPVGPGTQYFSTMSLQDWLRAATFLATREDARGAYNLSAPG